MKKVEKVVSKSGPRIKELREHAGILQNDLADYFSIAESTLSLYENQKRTVPGYIEDAAAKYFNVSVDYIRGRTDNKDLIIVEENYTIQMRDFYNKLVEMKLIEKGKDIDSETLDHMLKVLDANKDFIKKKK